MNSFEKRTEGYENKFAHEMELDFKVRSKRNNLLGIWAAEQMSLSADEASSYAASVRDLAVDGDSSTQNKVVTKILNDFQEKGVEIGEGEIEAEMNRLLSVAKESFK